MLTLIAATFSALKNVAIAAAVVNAVVLAAALVCMFFALRSKKDDSTT